MSDPIFAIPGLMEMQTPVSDGLTVYAELDPYSISDTLWAGIERVGPITMNGEPLDPPATYAEMSFASAEAGVPPAYTLNTEPSASNGTITIASDQASQWFVVPAQELPLWTGLWYWIFRVRDADDKSITVSRGTIRVTP